MSEFYRPDSIGQAVRVLSEKQPDIIAGGTDMMVRMRWGYRPAAVMDISGLDVLKGISINGSDLVIGTMTKHAEIANNEVVKQHALAVFQAARIIGSPQIRNMGTVGGNIANASPAADLLPPLFALNARVEILSVAGRRTLPISDLFTGPKQTVLRPDELIGWVRIPIESDVFSTYMRLGTRSSLSISKVGVALTAKIRKQQGSTILNNCSITLGSVAPTIIYAHSAMKILENRPLSQELVEKAARAASEDARPIDDIRSTAEYRKSMVRILTKRCLQAIE